ncbi:MAG: winged helix-turn-helix transcriptional regulator [Candidatus Heimdallarchaeaceae archaeon]
MIPYFNLFQYLQKNPLANYSQMAKALNITDKTAKVYYNYLVENGYIGKIVGDKKGLESVQARITVESLGLQTYNLLVYVNKLKNVEFLENLADYHNFTSYRNRILGSKQGLFFQFNIPEKSYEDLHDLFSELKQLNIITDYEILKSTGIYHSTLPDFKYYNNETGEWLWNVDSGLINLGQWFKHYISMDPKEDKIITKTENIQKKLTQLDLKLLRQLTKDAKEYSNKELAEIYDVSPTTITRRLQFLNEKVIKEYRLGYMRSKVQFVDLIMFRGYCSQDARNRLFRLVKEHPIPFDTGLILLDDGFLWRMNLPPAYTSALSTFLWGICDKIDFYHLNHSASMLYWFYDENFDVDKKEWKASSYEMYELPIQWVEQNLTKLL